MGIANPPNNGLMGNARNSAQMPLPPGPSASPVHAPDHRFNAATSKMPQPQSQVAFGKSAIPMDPYNAKGEPNQAVVPIPDTAKGMK